MITNLAFNADGSITRTMDDGSVATLTVTAPVVGPSDTEVDIVRSDGSVVKVPIPQA